jgi:hypothetical protein
VADADGAEPTQGSDQADKDADLGRQAHKDYNNYRFNNELK